MEHNKTSCSVEVTLKVIGGRWKVLILRELIKGIKRFCELHRALKGITQKMLTQQLYTSSLNGVKYKTTQNMTCLDGRLMSFEY